MLSKAGSNGGNAGVYCSDISLTDQCHKEDYAISYLLNAVVTIIKERNYLVHFLSIF